MNLKNNPNPYQQELGALFDEAPKSVLAAIAVFALTGGGDWLENAKRHVADEWAALHAAGVVPQKPGKVARSYMKADS